MAFLCLLMLHRETQTGGQRFRLAWEKRETLSQKLKQVGGLAQVVKHLFCNCQSPDQVHLLYYQKKKKANKILTNVKMIAVVQVVEHLPSHART
jgi:hypothetical protein